MIGILPQEVGVYLIQSRYGVSWLAMLFTWHPGFLFVIFVFMSVWQSQCQCLKQSDSMEAMYLLWIACECSAKPEKVLRAAFDQRAVLHELSIAVPV